MYVCTSVRQTNSLTRLHYDINHRRRWVACHLSSWLTYTHIHTYIVHRIVVVVPSWDSHAMLMLEACTAQLPALAFVRTVQFFRPINNERKFIFPSAVFAMCDAVAGTIALGSSMFPDENHTARRTRLELDLDRRSTPTINDALFFFFLLAGLSTINIEANPC